MRTRRTFPIAFAAVAWVTGWLVMGCHRRAADTHERDGDSREAHGQEVEQGQAHGHAHGHGHGHGHGQGEEGDASIGATFKAGKGVRLTEETGRLMGLELADVTDRFIPKWLRFTVQVFGESHRHGPGRQEHSDCEVQGAGFVGGASIAGVAAGQPVEVYAATNQAYAGVVQAVRQAGALGELEVVVGVSNAVNRLNVGAFVPARIRLPGEAMVPAVPEAAVLRTPEGTFVYAVNGESYLRTPVRTGAEGDGWVEIADGLLAGDAVVTKPVEALYLIELRATKGGGHSH